MNMQHAIALLYRVLRNTILKTTLTDESAFMGKMREAGVAEGNETEGWNLKDHVTADDIELVAKVVWAAENTKTSQQDMKNKAGDAS